MAMTSVLDKTVLMTSVLDKMVLMTSVLDKTVLMTSVLEKTVIWTIFIFVGKVNLLTNIRPKRCKFANSFTKR